METAPHFHWLRHTVAFLWSALLLAGSVLPGIPAPHFLWGDKAEHAGAYAVLTLLVYLVPRASGPRQRVLWAAVWACAYGVVIEAIQLPLPWRSFDPTDLLANVVGAVAMGGAILLALRRLPSRRRSEQ